jgi:hypothetical protein
LLGHAKYHLLILGVTTPFGQRRWSAFRSDRLEKARRRLRKIRFASRQLWQRRKAVRQLVLPVMCWQGAWATPAKQPLRTFRVGEVVAYQCDNSGVVVGAAGAAGEGDGGDEHLEMRYGHILDVGTFGEGSLRCISVRTGPSSSSSPGVVSVLATSLYSFISARDVGAGAGLKSRASNPQAHSQFRLEHATADDLGNDGLEMSSKSTRSIAAPVTAVTIEPVGRSELLGAVSSLLSRAKVPVSLEQKEMMDRILELDAANKRLQNDLVQERQSLLEASNLQRRTQAAMKCQICLTNEVSHVLTPCGHTLCGPCSSQLPQQKCPYCRGRIQNAVKFFLQEVDDEAV